MLQLQRFFERNFQSDSKAGRIGSLELNIKLAKWMGIPFIGHNEDESKFSKAIFNFYCAVIIVVISVTYTIFELYYLVLNKNNLYKLTQNACLSLLHLLSLFKIVNTMWRHREINQLFQKLKLTTRQFVVTPKQITAFQKGEFENKLLLSIYVLLVANNAVTAFTMLVLSPQYFAGEMFPYCVKLPNWMPQLLQIIYMGFSVSYLGLQIVSVDYFNIGMINQIRYQLNILILSFDELNSNNLNNEQAYAILKRIKDHHCILMEFRNQVEDIYKFPILMQFTSSLLVFAMTGFYAIVSNDDMSRDFPLYLYCGCILCQLFFYCWFGNKVFEKSKDLSTSAFSSAWYCFDKSFKSSFLLILTNAQRPFVFTAGGFVSLSLPSFIGILTKSYSYIALLRQMYDN